MANQIVEVDDHSSKWVLVLQPQKEVFELNLVDALFIEMDQVNPILLRHSCQTCYRLHVCLTHINFEGVVLPTPCFLCLGLVGK